MIILAVVVAGSIVYAVVSRDVLKSFFEKGDKPTSAQFSTTIDSSVNRNDDRNLLGLKEYNPTKQYQSGDTVVVSQPVYQAKILTEDQKEFKLDSKQDVTFRWTPLVPKPKEPVTYRLKVWQLMQGQTGIQAMKTNQPIVTKDVDASTEATISNIYTGPCKPPYLCDFVWSVEVLTKNNADTGTSGGSATGVIDASISSDGTATTR